MYYPYLRGKQNELILLRENAKFLSDSSIVPIIEPVKKNIAPLRKAIESLREEQTSFILIINPRHGDFKNDNSIIVNEIFNNMLNNYDNFCMGYIVDAKSELMDIEDFLASNLSEPIAFIHNGYPKAKELGELLNSSECIKKHIFLDDQILYRRQFKKNKIDKILIRDGFRKNINKAYPDIEPFSELHLTFEELGMNGFGDFLIVGDEYSDSGGPAYAVAIHLTYLNEDEIMYIYHFKSDSNDTPIDPAGKFSEALKKLINTAENNPSIMNTKAYKQYKDFYDKGHFPGLGYVKKLSMQHHIEVIANFLNGK